ELRADLQQQRAAVVRPLLHDAVAVAGEPDVVLAINEATVSAVRQDQVLAGVRVWTPIGKGCWHQRRVAPAVDHFALAIEFDDRWRGLRRIRLTANSLRRNQASSLEPARENKQMIPRIDACPTDFARHPIVGQRLRPKRIDAEMRWIEGGRAIRLCLVER